MADFKKTVNNRFGKPPRKKMELENVLDAPETAPAKKARRKTGRTVQFSTRVTSEFNEEFRVIAFEKRLKKVELLVLLLEEYKRNKDK